MRWSDLYKWTGVLCMDVGGLTLWELAEASRGYAEVRGGRARSGASMSEERLSDLGIEGF